MVKEVAADNNKEGAAFPVQGARLFCVFAARNAGCGRVSEIGVLHQVDEHADALQVGADQNALVRPVNAGPNNDNPNYILQIGNVFGFIISIENIL